MKRNKTYTAYFIQTNDTFEDDWYANECYTKRSAKQFDWIPPYPKYSKIGRTIKEFADDLIKGYILLNSQSNFTQNKGYGYGTKRINRRTPINWC